MKLLGILILVNSIAVTGWWVSTQGSHKGSVITVCLIAVFAGLALIIQERITELSVKGVGTVKATVQQVQADAETIAQLKTRIEAQSATVDLVADHAAKARELSEEATRKSKIAEEKLASLDAAISKAHESLEELDAITEFTATVVAAQNDDRKAFDQLKHWANDKSFRFSDRAAQAWNRIFEDYCKPYFISGLTIPWVDGFDPSKLTLPQLQQQYSDAPSNLRPALLEYIWNKTDFAKKDRLSFLIEVMKNDDSLKAVEYAGRYFTSGTDLKIKPLAVDYLVKWWEDNQDKFGE